RMARSSIRERGRARAGERRGETIADARGNCDPPLSVIAAVGRNPCCLIMRSAPHVMLLALLASACSTGVHADNLYYDEPTGGAGEHVAVYPFSNLEYFDVHADGLLTLRPAYQNTIALTCASGWARS